MTKINDTAIAYAGRVLQGECHSASVNAGWWRDRKSGVDLLKVVRDPQNPLEDLLRNAWISTKLALGHSELSEGLEGVRKDKMDDHLPWRKALEVELADAVIRIFDLAGAMNYDLGAAIAEKMAYNAHRPDHKPEAREAAGGKAV